MTARRSSLMRNLRRCFVRRNSKLRSVRWPSTNARARSLIVGRHEDPHRRHRARPFPLSHHPHRRQPAGLPRPRRLQRVRRTCSSSNPLLPVIEIGLLLVFLIHIYKTVTMYLGQPAGAARSATRRRSTPGTPSRKTLASSTMILSGLWLLVFLVIHVKAFRYGPMYEWPARRTRSLPPRDGELHATR